MPKDQNQPEAMSRSQIVALVDELVTFRIAEALVETGLEGLVLGEEPGSAA